MHVRKSDTFAASQHFSDREIYLMLKAVSRPREEAEPVEPLQGEGVPVTEVLKLMAGFIEGLKNLQINVQAPSVSVSPELKMPAMQSKKTVSRDRNGRIEAITEESTPKE